MSDEISIKVTVIKSGRATSTKQIYSADKVRSGINVKEKMAEITKDMIDGAVDFLLKDDKVTT